MPSILSITKEFRKTLRGRDRDILDHRILAEKPVTLLELGNKYQISRERVRQLQMKMIKHIESWLKMEIPNFEEEYSGLRRGFETASSIIA